MSDKEQYIKETKEAIIKALKNGGGFMNNIIGAKLKALADKYSTEDADDIVISMGLERLAGIPPEKGRR